MGSGAAIAIAAAALVVVFVVTKKQEAATVTRANNITRAKQNETLGAGDLLAIGVTTAGAIAGGPKGALAGAQVSGLRL